MNDNNDNDDDDDDDDEHHFKDAQINKKKKLNDGFLFNIHYNAHYVKILRPNNSNQFYSRHTEAFGHELRKHFSLNAPQYFPLLLLLFCALWTKKQTEKK